MAITIQQLEDAAKIADQLKAERDSATLKNMIATFSKYGSLTYRQEEYAKHLIESNDQSVIDSLRDFAMEWANDPKLREKYEVIARYYSTTQYYGKAVKSVTNAIKDCHAPNYRLCKPMVSNAYAQKVWDSHKAPAMWKVGDMVAIRANPKGNTHLPPQISRYKSRHNQECNYWGDLTYIVIEVNSKPISEAYTYNKTSGGCRWYKLLPVGVPCQVEVMECNLKKVLKKKVT